MAFTKTLAKEGAKYNIKATAIAPVCRLGKSASYMLSRRDQIAASAMTETVMPPEMLANVKVILLTLSVG